MSEDRKVMWITVEDPEPEDFKVIEEEMSSLGLDEEYDIIISDDRIDTMSKEEAEEMFETFLEHISSDLNRRNIQ